MQSAYKEVFTAKTILLHLLRRSIRKTSANFDVTNTVIRWHNNLFSTTVHSARSSFISREIQISLRYCWFHLVFNLPFVVQQRNTKNTLQNYVLFAVFIPKLFSYGDRAIRSLLFRLFKELMACNFQGDWSEVNACNFEGNILASLECFPQFPEVEAVFSTLLIFIGREKETAWGRSRLHLYI